MFDWMHNVYLGHGRDLVASALKVLIKQSVYDSLQLETMDEILAWIQQRMIKQCSQHRLLSLPFDDRYDDDDDDADKPVW